MSSVSYQEAFPSVAGEGEEEDSTAEEYKSPPIRTWKKFPPSTADRKSHFPDSASTPYNVGLGTTRITDSIGISPLRNFQQRRRYPCGALSPIDRLKLGVKRRERGGLCKSFELNQTCPINRKTTTSIADQSSIDQPLHNDLERSSLLLQPSREHEVSFSSIYSSNPSYESSGWCSRGQVVVRERARMEKIRVDGANGLRFSARRTKGCFVSGSSAGNNCSGNAAQPLSNTNTATTTTTTSDSIMRFSKSEMNPNKAVFTIDSKTSRILIVNKNACDLLGYSSKELCEIEFSDLLMNKSKSHVSALAEGQLNSEDGTLVLLSGKVVEMTTKSGANLAVSLWIRKIDTDGRCLAVAEPVERRVARLLINGQGAVLSAEYEALLLFQMESVEEFNNMHVTNLIPAIQLPDSCSGDSTGRLPKSVSKQKATGRTKDGLSFPLCLIIEPSAAEDDLNQFSVTLFVFNNLSGLMVIDETGLIESCNHHFSIIMFGYAQSKIIGHHISKVIPNFGTDLNRSRNATISSSSSESETDHVERTASDRLSSCADNVKVCLEFSTSKVNSSMVSELSDDISNITSDTRSMHGHTDEHGASGSAIPVAKSADNLSCHDNHENNRNLANNIGGKRLSAFNVKPGTVGQSAPESACDNTFEDDYSQMVDNEILTPVNETEYFVGNNTDAANTGGGGSGQCNSTSSRSINAPSSAPESVINDLPNTANSTPSLAIDSAGESNGSQQQQQSQQKKGVLNIQDGKYKGEAVHNDGNVIDIIYTVSAQTLPSGRVHCVWVSRDPDTEFSPGKSYEDGLADGELGDEEEEDDERNQNLTLTFDSVNSTVEKATAPNTTTATTSNTNPNGLLLGRGGAGAVPGNNSRPNSMSLLSQCEDELVAGEFSKQYSTLKQIGKGAYGYVKMAYRKSDRLLVIAKFILKEKLCPQFMVMTEEKKEIPMEIYLLTTVEHQNIVSVLDVFENDKFYQLVMEKHGCGMDLFEFIDRLPMMDEKLGCYIFRQIANAVDYLHSLNILHRDLKDENIIIDQNFHVKLIDFGSATFHEEGKLFSTFYGTTEYCSPEVLSGNKYAGPELEMWSLGVTLYVIMFFENPFVDIEETLHAALVIPQKVSKQLEQLLTVMLDKNPLTRCTMRELMADVWLNQEINPSLFNFAWVVPCEAFESNPEKYYNGQVLSSGTAISTTSPQDSLSLADGDSMLDVEGDDDDDEDDDDNSDSDQGDDDIAYESHTQADEDGSQLPEDNLIGDLVGTTDDECGPTAATLINVIEPKSTATVYTGEVVRSVTRFNSCKKRLKCGGVQNLSNSVPKGTTLSVLAIDDNDPEKDSIRHRYAGGKKRRQKRDQKKGRRAVLLNGIDASSGKKSFADGLISISKSENNLFEKSSKFSTDASGGGQKLKLFPGFDGVVTSMRDLQFEMSTSNDGDPIVTGTMNDFSRNQVLNTLAVSKEIVCRSEDERGGGVGYGDEGSSADKEKSPVDRNNSWTATVELTPKSSNRSNFQILSISYSGGQEELADNDCYDEDGYENDSWDEEEEDEPEAAVAEEIADVKR